MGLKEILDKNKEHNEWVKRLEEDIKVKKAALTELNKTEFDIEEFNNLNYEVAKQVFEIMKPNLEYGGQLLEIESVLQKIKENTYNILKVAHYYPVINDCNYLTDEQKNAVDRFLYMTRKGGYINTSSLGWYDIKLTKEIEQNLLNYLYEKGIIERWFEIICLNCNERTTIISEEQYLSNKKMYEIFDKQKDYKATEEEIHWCETLMENGERIWDISCSDCEEYKEIENFEQLKNRVRVKYRNITEPDLTYKNK